MLSVRLCVCSFQYELAKLAADELYENCKYDVCEELEYGSDASDEVCGYMQNYENLIAEQYELPVPNWRSGNFCGMFAILFIHK